MSKQLFVDPKKVRGADKAITVPEIPVNVYQKSVKDEVKNQPDQNDERISGCCV